MIFNRKPDNDTSTKQAKTLFDEEFGEVVCKSTTSRYVRVRINEHGKLIVTMPNSASLQSVTHLINTQRDKIRKMVQSQMSKRPVYVDGMNLGHSHKLRIVESSRDIPTKRVSGQLLTVALPIGWSPSDPESTKFISSAVKSVLRKSAVAYLPRRLSYLAELYGFEYSKIRFGNPKGRWGSCSSTGTISLNVALMNASHEIIDYVLIHELAHTRRMDHSPEFWSIVESIIPNYKQLKKALKSMSPIC